MTCKFLFKYNKPFEKKSQQLTQYCSNFFHIKLTKIQMLTIAGGKL